VEPHAPAARPPAPLCARRRAAAARGPPRPPCLCLGAASGSTSPRRASAPVRPAPALPAACLRGLERHGSACACARPLPCLPPACLAWGATAAPARRRRWRRRALQGGDCATSRRRHAHASCTRARARMTHILHAPRTQPWRPLRSSLRTCARCREVSPVPGPGLSRAPRTPAACADTQWLDRGTNVDAQSHRAPHPRGTQAGADIVVERCEGDIR